MSIPPSYPQYQPGTAPTPYNQKAILAFIFSLGGLVLGLHILGIPGLIIGNQARRQLLTSGEQGDGLAKAAVIIGWIDIAIIALAVIAVILFFILVVGLGVAGANTTDCITDASGFTCR